MLYSCAHMATVGVKGLKPSYSADLKFCCLTYKLVFVPIIFANEKLTNSAATALNETLEVSLQ